MRCALTLVMLAGLAHAALAQQGPPVPAYDPADGGAPAQALKFNAEFNLRTRFTFPSEFNDEPGDVSVARFGGGMDLSIAVSERDRVIVSLGSELSAYSFADDTAIASTNEPWDDVLSHVLGVAYRGRIDQRWGFIVGASVESSYQTGADVSDSVTFGGRLGATYSSSENFTVGLGVMVSSRLEENVLIIPFPILDWSINEQWALRTGRGTSRGARLEVAYTPAEPITLSLGMGVEAREFRLDDAGPIPDGVGRDWRAPASLAVEWRVAPQVTISAEIGAELWQNYVIDDANGDELADVNADLGFFAGVGVSFRF